MTIGPPRVIRKRQDPGTVRCQKCLEYGHWTYECKGERKHLHRPTRATQLERHINSQLNKSSESTTASRALSLVKRKELVHSDSDSDSSSSSSSFSSSTSTDSSSDSDDTGSSSEDSTASSSPKHRSKIQKTSGNAIKSSSSSSSTSTSDSDDSSV